MAIFILLALDAPLQGWGDVARDGRRPASDAPGRSAVTGLLANALGWRYEDGARTNALQESLRFATCLYSPSNYGLMTDFQTAYLIGTAAGWTRHGVEGRIGDYSEGNTILRKQFVTGSEYGVAIGLRDASPVSLDDLHAALERPARTLFLGRRSCIPTRPVLDGLVEAHTAAQALMTRTAGAVPVWYDEDEGPEVDRESMPDRRNFSTDRFAAGTRLFRSMMQGQRT